MTAGRLLEIGVGFVLPTAAVLWGIWVLWRSFRPGDVKMPTPVLDGIVGFLLICVFVVLIVLAWELFRAWRYPRGAQSGVPRISTNALPLERKAGRSASAAGPMMRRL